MTSDGALAAPRARLGAGLGWRGLGWSWHAASATAARRRDVRRIDKPRLGEVRAAARGLRTLSTECYLSTPGCGLQAQAAGCNPRLQAPRTPGPGPGPG